MASACRSGKFALMCLFALIAASLYARITFIWSGAVNDWDWTNKSNYVGTPSDLPTEGDEVELPAGTQVYVTNAASYVVVKDLYRIRPMAADVIASFFVDEGRSETINCAFNYNGKEGNGEHRRFGTLRKIGKGTLSIDSHKDDFVKSGLHDYTACLLAEEGTLMLMPTKSTGVNVRNGCLVVSNSATVVLSPGGDASFYGICGDGIITNGAASANLSIMDPTIVPVEEYEFRGTVSGDIRWYSSARVMLTGTNNVMASPNGFSSYGNAGAGEAGLGVTGLLKLGRTGERSSPGIMGGGLVTRDSGGGFLYLGVGEESDYNYTVWSTASGASFFDAGAVGGLKLSGSLNTSAGTAVQNLFVLAGSNSVPVEWSGSVQYRNKSGEKASFHITKRGTGAWWLRSVASGMHGAFAVENGTLMFDSIAEVGTDCSLGVADVLKAPVCGSVADIPDVPYAFSLGVTNADTVGSLEYKGTTDAVCSTRPISLFGQGRLVNSTASGFSFSGVTSQKDVDGTLTLDGVSGSGENVLSGVSDGEGVTSLAKQGSGTWLLGDSEGEFSGAVHVKEGTLRVVGAQPYSWYKWSITAMNAGDHIVGSYEFGLYDAEGKRVNGGLTYQADSTAIQPGQAGVVIGEGGGSCSFPWSGEPLPNLFDDLTSSCRMQGVDGDGNVVHSTPEDPKTWLSVVMRMPVNANPVTSYDLSPYPDGNTRRFKGFMLYGSVDGINWDVLDSAQSNTVTLSTTANVWYFSGTQQADGTADTHEGGKSIVASAAGQSVTKPFSKSSGIRVEAGAVLEATGLGAELPSLIVDAKNGMGTVRNFALAKTGTIDVLSAPAAGGDLPGTYENVRGWENLENWTVKLNGKAKPSARVTYRNGKICLIRGGLVLVVR